MYSSLFSVLGKLSLGDKESAIYIDGNKDVPTKIGEGPIINVNNGQLILNNGVIMNTNNERGYTAPIHLKNNSIFEMNGGRISSNKNYELIYDEWIYPTSAGAVYVSPGASFIMNNGLIDNNTGGFSGAIFTGDLFGSDKHAQVDINGGIITSNDTEGIYRFTGGIASYPASQININDGIISNNKSYHGGGVSVSDTYTIFDQNSPKVSIYKDYENFLLKNKAELNLNGGLIYKNRSQLKGAYTGAGGGVYVDSDFANFKKTMILDNISDNMGGGIYVSLPPRIQKLENLLVTENKAIKSHRQINIPGQAHLYPGYGGGLWNCPTGYIHIGDGHSVYIYDNQADLGGDDYYFHKKTSKFIIKQGNKIENLKGKHYSHLSPVTKEGNLIKFIEDSRENRLNISNNLIPDRLSYTNDRVELKSIYSNQLKEEAWRNAKVFIIGNQADKGGGIGSNANLETPEDKGKYELNIRKIWDESIDDDVSDKKVLVDIFIAPKDKTQEDVLRNYKNENNIYKYGEIELSKDNNWQASFHTSKYSKLDNILAHKLPATFIDKGLPFTEEYLDSKGYKYLIIEQGDEYYSLVKKNEDRTYVNILAVDLTNYKYKELPVIKKWDSSIKEKDIPESIRIYLLKDGNLYRDKYGRTRSLVLNEANNWSGTFEKLPTDSSFPSAYWIVEDSGEFVPYIKIRDGRLLSMDIKRIGKNDFNHANTSPEKHILTEHIDYIPVLVKSKDHDYKLKLRFKEGTYIVDIISNRAPYLDSLPPILVTEPINSYNVQYYNNEHNQPFPNNFAQLKLEQIEKGKSLDNTPYIIELLIDENNILNIRIPNTKEDEGDEQRLSVENIKIGEIPYIEIKNYYGPDHDIEIEKIWLTDKKDQIPVNLKVKIFKDGEEFEYLFLSEDKKWQAKLENLKGKIKDQDYNFIEEKLENFHENQNYNYKLELKALDENINKIDIDILGQRYSLKDKRFSNEILSKILSGSNYSYEVKDPAQGLALVEIVEYDDGRYRIIYPINLMLREVLEVNFENKYRPPETPPDTPPEEPPETPPDTTPEEPPETPPEEPEDPPEEPPETPDVPPEEPHEIPEEPDRPEPPEPEQPEEPDKPSPPEPDLPEKPDPEPPTDPPEEKPIKPGKKIPKTGRRQVDLVIGSVLLIFIVSLVSTDIFKKKSS